MKIKYLALFYLLIFSVSSFDWKYYRDNNFSQDATKEYPRWWMTFEHFRNHGYKYDLQVSPFIFEDTNFNWQYYVSHNNLNINNKPEALEHYKNIGSAKHLDYCKNLNIEICLHLYNLDLMEEFVQKINKFMLLNKENNYHITVALPIIEENSNIIKHVHDYLYSNLNRSNDKIDIILCKNKGADIGGFLLSLDNIIKKNRPVDYIIKLHTKSEKVWRNMLTSFMNVHVNNILSNYDCIYSNKFDSDPNTDYITTFTVQKILQKFKLPYHTFNFSAGNMFIVSSKFLDFLKQYNILDMYEMLNESKFLNNGDGTIEHGFERFFGYVIDHLQLKTFIMDYYE